jgi:hypothetical protein
VQDDVRQLLGMPKPEMAAQAADTSLEKAFGMDGKSGRKMSSRSEGKTYETLEEGSGFRMSRKLVMTLALFLLAAGGVVMIYEEFGVSNDPLGWHAQKNVPVHSSTPDLPLPLDTPPSFPTRPRLFQVPPRPFSTSLLPRITPPPRAQHTNAHNPKHPTLPKLSLSLSLPLPTSCDVKITGSVTERCHGGRGRDGVEARARRGKGVDGLCRDAA